MAQLKDLVVNGPARILGKSFASTFVGPLDGKASSATNDKNGNDITGYLKDVSTSEQELIFTKGDGSTVSVQSASSAVDFASSATLATSATYDANGNALSDNLKSLEVSNGVITTTKADGSTASHTIDKASSATEATNASTASYDSQGNPITDYIKNFSINSNRIIVTKGNGSTAEETISYASSADMASTASVDESGNTISEYIKSIAIENATMTLTKGNGSTESITVDNVSSASSASYAGSASSATYDSNNNDISTYIRNIAINNATMTLTKGNGSTESIIIDKASSATVADSASTASVDISGNNISSYIKSVSKTGSSLTFTKGDGTTFAEEVGSDIPNASSETAGISKIYASTGTNSDGSMTQEAISSYVNGLESMISSIVGFRVDIPVSGELPESGEDGILYLIPVDDPESDNIYDEYVWVTISGEGEDPDTSYFEKIGTTTLDLSGYYTSTEVNNITNNLVKSITVNAGVMTITDGDNSASTLTLDKASSADLASSASISTYAMQDASSQTIDSTYFKSIAISNNTMTLTKGNGSTSSITIEAASSADLASSALISTNAMQDASSQTIDSTYLKEVTIADNTMTLTKGNGSTSSITIEAASSASTATYAGTATYAMAASTALAVHLDGMSTAVNAIESGTMIDFGWEE